MSDTETTTPAAETNLVMAYEAVVEQGVIHVPPNIPDGFRVYIIVPVAQQRPEPGTAEWRKPFEAFEAFIRKHPAPKNIDELSDEELNAIVHEARRQRHAA